MVEKKIIKTIRIGLMAVWIILLLMLISIISFLNPQWFTKSESIQEAKTMPTLGWPLPDSTQINNLSNADLILYGKELISHTSKYLGPKGRVAQISNGMNCQNCHLKAGTQYLGNSYIAVNSNYPKPRARSGTVESIEKRINDCIERSLNGTVLSIESKEMKSMVAYISWVGSNVEKGITPEGSHISKLKFLDRAANPKKGELIFIQTCVRCHGKNGEGIMSENSNEWKYPPLMGEHSYNVGAGLYRISNFAGFIKANMPNDLATHDKPVLTDEEAWDVAAFINSQLRPSKDLSQDWPDISKKPFDYPFGPFADSFTEEEHKFGPFQKIVK